MTIDGNRDELNSLSQCEVAITGRLASMTRAEAITVVENAGGTYAADVTPSTDVLAIGENGWPLQDDGQLTRALRTAQQLESKGRITVVSEAEFLALAGLEEHHEGLSRLFTSKQLSRMLDVPLAQIRAWVRAGLIRPEQTAGPIPHFGFREVANARKLHELARSRVGMDKVRRSLNHLERWLPDAERSIDRLESRSRGGPLQVRLADGRRADADGQLHFDFEKTPPATPALIARLDPTELSQAEASFEAGLVAEGEGRLEEAAKAYDRALRAGARLAEVAFNLGNVLYRMSQVNEAAQRFKQAIDLDPNFPEAWNNLGNTMSDLERVPRAIEAYRRALQLDPNYADAHYNLARTLTDTGRAEEAQPHWRAYLARDTNSAWAAEARAYLDDEKG